VIARHKRGEVRGDYRSRWEHRQRNHDAR